MTNEQLIKKMKEDMNIRNFSKCTYDSYLGKTKDIMKYFGGKEIRRSNNRRIKGVSIKIFKRRKKISRWVNKLLQFSNKIYL